MQKSAYVAAAVLGFTILSSAGASAASLLSTASSTPPNASFFEEVRQGCGTGYRRGPYGGCIRQTGPVGPYGANKCWFRNGVKVCR